MDNGPVSSPVPQKHSLTPSQQQQIIIIIQFIYLSALQQPDKANYSQALKQQYRIKYNILKSTNDLQIKN
jgi:hypothetical protein